MVLKRSGYIEEGMELRVVFFNYPSCLLRSKDSFKNGDEWLKIVSHFSDFFLLGNTKEGKLVANCNLTKNKMIESKTSQLLIDLSK